MNRDRELGVAGNPVMVFRSLVMPSPPRPAGLIQRYREELQARHYARRTVNTYPREMGSAEVNAFLTHLAVEGQVSASTQNQALSALLFLYRDLLERDLDLEGVVRAVLERMYGSGVRLMEALRLRVKDLDCDACKSKTLLRGMAVCNSPERSDASTGMRIGSGPGSGCSPSTSAGAMSKQDSRVGITSIRAWCKKRFAAPCSRQRSARPPHHTASVIPFPPTCSSVAMTSARFRNCSATTTSEP